MNPLRTNHSQTIVLDKKIQLSVLEVKTLRGTSPTFPQQGLFKYIYIAIKLTADGQNSEHFKLSFTWRAQESSPPGLWNDNPVTQGLGFGEPSKLANPLPSPLIGCFCNTWHEVHGSEAQELTASRGVSDCLCLVGFHLVLPCCN
jgi:hypothetical protein